MRNYVMEFIGTMFLVLSIGLGAVPGEMRPIAIGCMLMVMVYAGGHISGAHYNPAVTLAIWMRGKISAGDVGPYILAQIAGAAVAAIICSVVNGATFAPAPAATAGFTNALLVEILGTFALALVILNVATTRKLEGNYIYGLAIGFTVLTMAYIGGGVSGGAYNPAVGLGPILIDSVMGGGHFGNVPLYLVGPLAGGALAAVVFKYLNPEE